MIAEPRPPRILLLHPKAGTHPDAAKLAAHASGAAMYMRRVGYDCEPGSVVDYHDLDTRLTDALRADKFYSRVIFDGAWASVGIMARIAQRCLETEFALWVHTNPHYVGAAAEEVKIIKAGVDVQKQFLNFHLAASRLPFCRWLRLTAVTPCLYLPNYFQYMTSGGLKKWSNFLTRDPE